MLARSAKRDFELNGTNQGGGSPCCSFTPPAERDETVHLIPDKFDLYRQPTESQMFGRYGGLKCLGLHLGVMMGRIIVEEILKSLP